MSSLFLLTFATEFIRQKWRVWIETGMRAGGLFTRVVGVGHGVPVVLPEIGRRQPRQTPADTPWVEPRVHTHFLMLAQKHYDTGTPPAPPRNRALPRFQERLRTTDTTRVMTVRGTTNHSMTLLKVPSASCACAARIR